MSAAPIELKNSRRRFEKSTYTPLKTRQPGEEEPADALGRAALVRALQLTPAELDRLEEQLSDEGERAALEAMRGLATALSAPATLAAAAELAQVPGRSLIAVAGALKSLRRELGDQLARGVRELDRRYEAAQKVAPPPVAAAPEPPVPAPGVADTVYARPGSARTADAPPAAGDEAVMAHDRAGGESAGHLAALAAAAPAVESALQLPATLLAASQLSPAVAGVEGQPAARAVLATAFGSSLAARAPELSTWAAQAEPDRVAALIDQVRPVLPAPRAMGLTRLHDALAEVGYRQLVADLFIDAVNSLTRRPLEPVGLLHLERLEMTPLQIERGELLYSLPLAPRERVTLAHKEWSIREEEFSEFIQDFLENFSEKGVTETEDIASSTETQTRHANALSMSQSPTGTRGATMTAPVDVTANPAQSAVEDLAARLESMEHSRTITSKASARTIKNHKVSFTVTTVSGIEDFTARVIPNPHKDQSMLVDYYRRMRRWRTDLYRYGVRLTYDVVLPDPGRELRRRYTELREIDAQLAQPFYFGLRTTDLTPGNYTYYGGRYGVALPPPPEQSQRLQVSRTVDYPNDPKQAQRLEELRLDVPAGYQLQSLAASVDVSTWNTAVAPPDRARLLWVTVMAGTFRRPFGPGVDDYVIGSTAINPAEVSQQGAVVVEFRSQYAHNGVFKVTGVVVPTATTMQTWRIRCWTMLREAAYADYLQNQDRLRQRRAALARDIATTDALTLRKMEREQIMRAVLEWLFPGFNDANSVLTNAQNPGTLDADTWRAVMEYGEYIKFVQSAIDWDNVMVFLFPYFWDTYWSQEEKLFLAHPDAIHREFLRAGAARIVLAIKPGFEEEVVSLLDRGQLGQLPEGHRFHKLVEDVQQANALYEQTAQAPQEEDEGDNPRVPGLLIGSWFDYTPTGALDIAVTLTKVQQAP